MKLYLQTPSKAYVTATPEELDRLRSELTYTNTSAAHEVKRLYGAEWFQRKDPVKWQATIDAAKAKVKRTLITQDLMGYYIYPGSIPYLSFVPEEVIDDRIYPEPKSIPWKKKLPFELYPYQEESWKKLLLVKHGNVELCTGSGKSAIILKICRETGFKTAIIAPSKSIFNELLEKFENHFGKDKVGAFGSGKKRLGKLFTVCISDSICNVKPGTEEWEFFSKLEMLCVDESHCWGAETLEEICYGVLAEVPYRMFFSGTQIRNDGASLLLQSIIGQTVHTLTTKEAVDNGYICPHEYRIVNIESSNPNFNSQDALEQKRVHFLKNKNICAFIAKLVNVAATAKQQTLVLVEELEQISMLMKLLTVPTVYAHSEKKPDRLRELGLEKVDPTDSIEKFNKAEAMCLVGTSTIQCGCNIFANSNTVNWVGGSSPIKTLQGAVGRSVRLHSHNPYKDHCVPKTNCLIWDFNVQDCFVMTKHLKERIVFYNKSGSPIKYINLKK